MGKEAPSDTGSSALINNADVVMVISDVYILCENPARALSDFAHNFLCTVHRPPSLNGSLPLNLVNLKALQPAHESLAMPTSMALKLRLW